MLRKEQKALIGRRRGTELQLAFSQPFRNEYLQLPVFTTRLEALYGLTFILVAPGHEVVDFVTDPDYLEEVESYQARYENGQESSSRCISPRCQGKHCHDTWIFTYY